MCPGAIWHSAKPCHNEMMCRSVLKMLHAREFNTAAGFSVELPCLSSRSFSSVTGKTAGPGRKPMSSRFSGAVSQSRVRAQRSVSVDQAGRSVRCRWCRTKFKTSIVNGITQDAGGETPPPDGAVASPAPGSSDPNINLPTHIGRFQIRNFLGEGGFGTVYHAYDPHLSGRSRSRCPAPASSAHRGRVSPVPG